MHARSIVLFVAAVGFGSVHAESPRHTAAFALELGATPESVMASLGERYKNCSVVRSIYHEVAGETAERTAAVAINPGLTFNDIGAADVCPYSPAGSGITDGIEATFAHPQVDAKQSLYSLQVERLYPDVVYAQPARLRNSFDELRAELFRIYGRPVDERREKVASASANLAASLGIGKSVSREDYVVRYLWATKGRLATTEYEDAACACGGPYVKAIIEISRSPSTIPRNKYYVLSVTLRVEDPELRIRQEAWNAQWQQQK